MLVNLVALLPSYIIFFFTDETPQFLKTLDRTFEALSVARRCGMIDEVRKLITILKSDSDLKVTLKTI